MATRAELHEKYGIFRLMPPDIANQQLSEKDAEMYEQFLQMQKAYYDDFDNPGDDDD